MCGPMTGDMDPNRHWAVDCREESDSGSGGGLQGVRVLASNRRGGEECSFWQTDSHRPASRDSECGLTVSDLSRR